MTVILTLTNSSQELDVKVSFDYDGNITSVDKLNCTYELIPCGAWKIAAGYLLDRAAKEYGYNTKRTFTSIALESFAYDTFKSFIISFLVSI